MKGYLALLAIAATTLSAHADFYCRWDPNAAPSSFLRVHTNTGTAYSITGWPQRKVQYREVKVQKARNGTFVIVVNGDVPLVQGAATGSGTLWFDQNEVTYPYEAYWNPRIPGGPYRQAIRGVCWTDHNQKKSRLPGERPVIQP